MRRGAFAAAVAAFVACGPVDGPPPPRSPVNVCPDFPCDAYAPYQAGAVAACTRGTCTVAKQIDYLLVVSVPETSFFAPNVTFAIASKDLFTRPDPGGDCSGSGTKTSTVPCARLPDVGTVSGEYIVYASVSDPGQAAPFYLGNGGPPQPPTAIPVHTTFRPLFSPSASVAATDPATFGVPLLPVPAGVITANPVLVKGPAGGPVVGFNAVLAAGPYEVTVMPDPPYDTVFPPDVSVVTVATGQQQAADELLAVDKYPDPSAMTPVLPTFDIAVGDPALPLDGGVAYLRDAASQRRVSSLVTLGAANKTTPVMHRVTLNTNRHAPAAQGFAGLELVVEPPPGAVARPTLVIGAVANIIPVGEEYPALPAPALVSGNVTSRATGAAVAADLQITSTKILQVDPRGTLETSLHYVAHVSTDDVGQYAAPLPPGEYTVVVTPRDGGAGKLAAGTLKVDPGARQQAGKSFQVSEKHAVRGVARVSDGRPLAAARVTAHVAASMRASAPPESWPRPAETTTADDGTFALALDSGTYDITVQPAEGSRLPWLVSTSRVVDETDVSLEDFLVPAPIAAGLVLKDPLLNPIQRAIVRFFAAPAATQAAASPPLVEIGETITDASGACAMYLAGPPK